MPAMGTKSRKVIWGGRIGAAKINAEHARQRAKEAARKADRAEAYAWSLRMEGYGGSAQPSPTIALGVKSYKPMNSRPFSGAYYTGFKAVAGQNPSDLSCRTFETDEPFVPARRPGRVAHP